MIDDQFNPIKNWILNGGENDFVTLTRKGENFKLISNLYITELSFRHVD